MSVRWQRVRWTRRTYIAGGSVTGQPERQVSDPVSTQQDSAIGPDAPGRPMASPAAEKGPNRLLVRYGKFLVVGFTGVFVNLAVFVLTVDAVSNTPLTNFYSSVLHFATKTAADPALYVLGSAVAFGVATLWNFALNSLWTFRTSAARRYSRRGRLALYFGVSLGSLAVNEAILIATGTVLPPLIGQGVGIVAGSVVGFLGNNRYTFAEVANS